MTKSTVTLELTVHERERIRGYGDTATYEYALRHEKLGSELRFRCQRKDLESILKDMGADTDKFDDVSDVTIADVGDELSRSSTGMPLSERDQEELRGFIDTKPKPRAQRKPGFKIRIG